MARIPDSEIERLKLQVSMVRLAEEAGIALKAHGKDRIGRCPFHDDKTPSLVISPKSNLWHCLGACQAGGSVVDWVMRFENVSFRRAVELLRAQAGLAPELAESGASSLAVIEGEPKSRPGPAKRFGRLLQQEADRLLSDDDQVLLQRVIGYYHETLKQSPEALAYLAKRGLEHPELVDHFQLGFANRTLGYRLPEMQSKAGATLRGALQRIGILRGTGHEHFNGSLVVPVFSANGEVSEAYGRKITPRLRPGTPLHLYLPGPHRGVFNAAGLVGQEEVILCESLIDALTFWSAGYRNVTCAYGIEGFTAEILAAFVQYGIKRVLIAYDADDAGNTAAEKLATKLMAECFECYRCRFPKGMDANQYALEVKPAAKSLGLVIRQAEWIGKGAAPPRLVVGGSGLVEGQPVQPATAVDDDISLLVAAPAPASAVAPVAVETEAERATKEENPPVLGAAVVPSLPAAPALEVSERDVVLALGDRRYRVRGLDKNLAFDVLKVNVLVSRAEAMHVDTFDLYHAKARALFARLASVELGVEEAVVQRDLGQLLLALEQQQDALIKGLKSDDRQAQRAPLSPEDESQALALLRDPNLVERIVADVEATGVVGETSNALVAYLACVSRKLDKPLAILIQSTSAAGKSTLMDAVLALMPEAERVQYSAMTGQSLFYLGEHSMQHKILAIAEEEGVRQAGYALKLLQSQGELTMASTGKDPTSGQLVTQEYRVQGPVMLFLTTTAIDIDEELLNRCLVLTINESREQTAAIQARQRSSRTLEGLLSKTRSDDLLATHRAAQTLLKPLAVVNPFAEQLSFASDRVRLRRDHAKYLALIDAIALLQQFQRERKSVRQGEKVLDYIEVTPTDIALANRLAHEVLGRSLDELPPQTRQLLGQIQHYVTTQAQTQAIDPALVRFTRRQLRQVAGFSDTQLRVHLDRLVGLEYVTAHAGRNGQRYQYELLFDGDLDSQAPQAIGLIVADGLNSIPMTSDLAGSDAKLAGCLRPACGDLAGTLRSEEMAVSARPDTISPPLAAALAENALLEREKTAASYRNGASYP